MKHSLFVALIALGVMTVMTAPALAHHSSAMFDETKTITLQGVVKEWQLTNPHSWLLVEVMEKNGKVTVWGFEAEGPSTLLRAGIKPSDLKAGTKLTISGHPMRNGEKAAIWLTATREDGKKLEPRAGFAVK
jgi:hypothetical protein